MNFYSQINKSVRMAILFLTFGLFIFVSITSSFNWPKIENQEAIPKINKSVQRTLQQQYSKLFKEKKFIEAAQQFKTIHERCKSKDSDKDYNLAATELTAFQFALVENPVTKQIATELAKDQTISGRTALAELLLITSAGNNYTGSIYTQKTNPLSEEMAALGVELMEKDPDVFVRGIAEQAVAAKINRENDGPQLWWPKKTDNPEWFNKWYTQSPNNFLVYDYVRQAVQQGIHYSSESLKESAKEWISRSEKFADDAAVRGGSRKYIKEKLEGVYKQYNKLLKTNDLSKVRNEWVDLRLKIRELVMLSPDLDIKDFVYVKRRNHLYQHNIANNVPMANRFPPGTDILRKRDFDPSSDPESLLKDQLGTGSIRGMDLYWEADRVVFSFTPQTYKSLDKWSSWDDQALSESNLYEINVDGTGLKQLTNDTLHADQAPCYLPNGDVVFASTRADIASECGPWPQQAVTMSIYKLEFQANGSNQIKRLTHNKDFDHYPHVLNNGLIGFTRWDYQERHFYYPHTIWGCRPDGTQSDLIYKSHLSDGPHSLRDAMPIPESDKLFAIACGHHSIPEGALALLDLSYELNDPSAISYVTPLASETEGGYGKNLQSVPEGGVRDAMALDWGGKYQSPWPLSERSLLISAMYHIPVSCGSMIYYVDVFGNKELLARDLIYELVDPKMIIARQKPPVFPNMTDPNKLYADIYINDVYEGLEGVPKGSAKYIRMVSKVNWPYPKGNQFGALRWFVDQGSSPTFGFFSWSPTRIIGTVPIEEDGSAYFKAPVEMALSFELLDKDMRQIRRMRSHVEFMRGEKRGCVGCHEANSYSVQTQSTNTLALKRKASVPRPPSYEGGDRVLLDYAKHVQPVFDAHCVSCHGETDPKGGLELTSRPDPFGFLQSYRSLFGFKYGEKLPTGGDEWYKTYFAEEYEQHAIKWRGSSKEERKEFDIIYNQIIQGKYPNQLVTIISRRGDAHITQPYEAGAYKSKLIAHLFDDQEHVQIRENLKEHEWEALVSFVDNNAPATGWFYAKQDQNGNDFKRKVNNKWVDDLRRVYIKYPDPWQNRTPNDENGVPEWPAVPTKVQTLDENN